jgi:carbamoyltransferase
MNTVISIYGMSDRNKFKYPGFVHDHNFSVLQENRLMSYCHLERETRMKYDNQFHHHAERLLLDKGLYNITPETRFLFVNSFVGSSFLSDRGRIRFDCLNREHDLLKPVRGYGWIQHKDWEGFEVEAWSVSHEIAHAFSVVPFAAGLRENSLLISFDGGSSTGNFAAFHYKGGALTQLESHWELSQLSKLFNDNGLSFGIINAAPGEHCSVPGKLMGYASWGRKDEKVSAWLKEHDFFRNAWGDRASFYKEARTFFNWQGSLENNADPFLFTIAACLQEHFHEGILTKIAALAEQTNADYLYYAGGCALNIVANSDLVSNGWFRDVYISPCCNDSGLSIGASAYWTFLHGNEMPVSSPYLNNLNCIDNYTFSPEDIMAAGQSLHNGKVIGVCNGSAEAGPRALGNRSILCLANSKDLANRVSMEIKEREWYRPVAPIMLEKNARLVTGLRKIHQLSGYMLLDFNILEDYRQSIEGVVHANGTSRIQTIFDREDNPFIFDLLKYLDHQHQVKALINTSFNGKGEPIVQTEEDARRSASKMKLDGLVINGKFEEL